MLSSNPKGESEVESKGKGGMKIFIPRLKRNGTKQKNVGQPETQGGGDPGSYSTSKFYTKEYSDGGDVEEDDNVRRGHDNDPDDAEKREMKRTSAAMLDSQKRTRNGNNGSYRSSYRKRKAAVDSPLRKQCKKLMNHVVQLKESNEFYASKLQELQDTNVHEAHKLQGHNEVLNRRCVELNEEIEKWKRRCYNLRDKNAIFLRNQELKKVHKELSEDLEVCKSVVCRLNSELLAYQEKIGILEESHAEGRRSEEATKDFLQAPRAHLFPLLLAYDEIIKEKDEIIKEHENTLKAFKTRCKEIVKENEDIHGALSDKQEKGVVSVDEWEVLHSNAVLVLQENDILHEQLAMLKHKETNMTKHYEDKVHKLKSRIVELEEERGILKESVLKSERQCQSLLEQQSRFSEILEKRIPVDQHEASVQQCKQLFEELRTNYEVERTNLMEKLEGARKEHVRFQTDISEMENCNLRLQASLTKCEETLASNTAHFKEVYKAMMEAMKERDTAIATMEESRRISERALEEKNNYEFSLEEQRATNENLVQYGERQSSLLAELQLKIKEMDSIHNRDFQKFLGKIKDLEKSKEQLHIEQKHKTQFWEALLSEKSKRMEHLEAEKKQLEADLETIWKTTTSAFKDIKTAKPSGGSS